MPWAAIMVSWTFPENWITFPSFNIPRRPRWISSGQGQPISMEETSGRIAFLWTDPLHMVPSVLKCFCQNSLHNTLFGTWKNLQNPFPSDLQSLMITSVISLFPALN
jgi:hypothetical protein